MAQQIDTEEQLQTESPADIVDWNRNAERYATTSGMAVVDDRTYAQFREPLWTCIGDLTNRTVLDLGCGHGWLTRAMLDRGADVIGIDGSAELLAKAAALCPGTRFLQHDLALGLPTIDRRFDLVVAYMVLMDIPDLDPLFRALREHCLAGTRLIATINHPAFFYSDLEQDSDGAWFRKVKKYLTHEIWRIPTFGGHNHYHRPLSFYFELLRRSGFLVRTFVEPVPIPATTAAAREFRREIPVFALLEAVYFPNAA